MPKGKFQGFYYGLGMQLDEASVEKAGQQLEGRLNKVVDNVTKQVVSISDAVAKGTKNIDTKNLVASLVEAQKELNQFQDFDPSKLQHQIDGLNETVNKLTDNLGEVKEKLMSFTNDISNRLSNIEILTPKMGADALKKDILEMKNIVSSLSEISKTSEIDIPTDLLEASIKKIKDGMASIKASGNSLELFSDKDIAKEFVAITNLLRNIGDPVASLKKEFVDLALVFNDSFADDNVAKIFKNNLGYQIESETLKLERAKNEIKQYKDMVDSLNSTTHDWQNKLSSSDSELLNTFKSSTTVENLDVIIKKIEEYEKTLHELDDVKNVDYRNTMENMLALIQSTEKTMSSMDKKNLDSLLSVWKNAFNGNDLQSGNKLSVLWLEDYRDNIKIVVEEIEAESKNLEQIIRKTQDRLYMLEGREKEQISKTQKNTTQKSKRNVVQGVVAEVEAKIKINKSEWAKSINDAILSLTAINEKGNSKIKPVVIKVQTNKKDLVDQITAIRDQVNSALGGDKRTNKSTVNEAGETVTPDVTKFNKRFKEFMRNLEKRKQEITAYLKDEWHPALKEAFSFKMELLGIDNKSMTEKIDTHILSTVDAINIALAEKPLEFHSNIDALIEEIQNKVENIKLNGNISLGVGNVAINPQNLSNVNLIAGNITQNRGQTPTTSIIPPANKTSVQKQTKSPLGTIDKQKIYNDAVNRLNSASLTLDMVKDGANKLYKQLINAEEGTEKYYQAQILLTTLLSKWRGKIGAKSKNKQPEVPGLLGVRGANANWEKYLIDNGILLDPKNSRLILSASKLEEIYGLTKPKISSASKRTKITTKKSEMTPEEVLANRFNNGKEVIEYFISLAKMGKNLNLIREIADKPITADMFNDDSLTKWIRGKVYTKEDVGSYAPGKKITKEALDKFLSTMGITEADLAEANTKEETEFLTPLKKYIYTFMQNRQKLNTLLTTLTESQSGKTVVDGYNAIGSDKTEYLAGNLSSVIKNLTPKTPTTKAQQYVSDIFNKYNIDLSKLPSAKTYAEQWQIIQQQLIGKEGLDFNSLMSDLGQLKGNVGKTYENFMALLKVARAYMETSNSLGEVGREADLLIKGRTEKVNTKRRRWNNQTGQYDDVESEVIRTVQQGIRGLLKQLKVVFENETGQTVLGYNLGKGYIPDDIFLSPQGSFTKIIDKLTSALNDSSKILFDQKSFIMDGSRDVDRWVTPNSTNNSIYQPNTVALTEKGQIQKWILNTRKLISVLENNNSLTEEQSNRLLKLKEHLPSLETRLKTADNKKVTYNKSYDQATSDLPLAQKGYINARENLATLVNQYTSERMSAITDALSKKQLGTLSDKEVKSIQDTLYNIVNLNEQLQKGTITQEEYIKKVTEAYILMRNATTDEAKITAKTDAEKLAQATLLVKRYQEEEALLKKIIRTQKPKATTSLVENKTPSESTLSSRTANAGNVPIDNSGATQVAIPQGTVSIPNGNIVLGGTIGDIATQTTLQAIYDLLITKKSGINTEYDSRIEAIKKVIAKRETAERQSLENAKKKVEEERKGFTEVKKKTTEEKKGTEEVKKKVIEEKKVIEPTKTESDVVKNNPQIKIATNDILQSVGKTKQELWTAVQKTQQSVEAGNALFREHSFSIKDGRVIDVMQGSYALAPSSKKSNFDTHGHIHPRNSLFSSIDLEYIRDIRKKNVSYDIETLISPRFTHTLSGLSKIAPEAMDNLIETFKLIESIYIPSEVRDTAKESALYYFAKNNGIDYSRKQINADGTLSDITEQTERFSQEILDKFLKNIQNRIEYRSIKKDDPKYDTLSKLISNQIKELNQDSVYNKLNKDTLVDYINFDMFKNATMLQNAIGRNWDLTLFYDNLVGLLKAVEKSGQQIPPKSTLGKIKQAISEVTKLTSDPIEQAKVMNKVKPELISYIGYNPNVRIDNRKGLEKEWERIISLDKSGQISKDLKKYGEFSKREKNVEMQIDALDGLDNKTTEELKLELANLEKLRNEGQVDPRFATAENQNTIINLLKNGVKVIGKISDDGASNSGKSKTPKIPDTTKVNTQFDTIRKINGINNDSSLYKRYMSAKSNLDSALSDASTKGKNFAKEDANKIKALSNEVTKLGRQIINASNSLDQFKERGGQAFTSTANEVRTLKDEMLELAYKNASASHMLLSNVSYDEVTQKMSYNLTDLEGNVTKVTMAYDDLFGNILTMSDKTTNSVSQIYKTIEGEMTKRISINNLTKDTPNLEKSKEYKDYLSRYDAMINAQDVLREKGELATKTEKDGLISITNKVEEARIKFEKLANASEQFKSKIKDQNDLDPLPNGFNMEDETLLEQQMKNFALNQEGLTEKQKKMINETWNFKNAQDGATYSVLKGKDQIASMAIEMDKGSQSLGRYTIETKKYTSGFDKFMTSLQSKWQEVIRYLATFGSLYRVWGELQRGVQYIKEIDSALTELKKVTDETEETYNRFLNTAAKTADKVGSTIKEVVSSTADWARLGYSLEEAANLAESTSVLLNVSEFQSIDDATSALVSTMQAFGYAAKDSMHVVDVMNEIGNNYAVSSDGVATALQDSASSLMAANNSYQEAVSLIAAANRVVILRHGL